MNELYYYLYGSKMREHKKKSSPNDTYIQSHFVHIKISTIFVRHSRKKVFKLDTSKTPQI